MNRSYKLYDQRPFFSDIRSLLAASAADFGEKCAVSYRTSPFDDEKITVSYVELESRVRALGTEFISRGMSGKHCVLIGKLSFTWIISYLSLLSIGAVLVPLDPEWSAEDLAATARKANASFLICESEQREKIPFICESTGIESVLYDKEELGETVESLVALGQAKIDAGDNSFDKVTVDTDALSLLVFTSGTTGQGKGVMLSQKCILSNIFGAQQIEKLGKKTIGVLPPHHTFGSTIGVLAPICIGCELYISSGLKYFQKEMLSETPDILILVPLFLETFAAKIRASAKKQGKDKVLEKMLKASGNMQKIGLNVAGGLFGGIMKAFGGKLKNVICGGAPMSEDVFSLFSSLGLRVMNGYGITECSPLISVNRPKHIVPGSAGMPVPNISVKIDGCGDDGEGEICVKGPNVMLGYYDDEEATRAVIDEDGYFHTGDIGKLDPENGFVFITGRMKNLIILSNGKNVYPEEIEAELAKIPGVLETVVYEGQSKRGIAYNQIVAEMYLDPEFKPETDAKEYLKPYIDKYNKSAVVYKRIGTVRMRGCEFPKNTLRKIIRYKIDRTID